MARDREPAFRDEIPAWGWVALGFTRLWALLPILLLALGIWWWTHGGAQHAPRWAKKVVQHARTTADSVLGR